MEKLTIPFPTAELVKKSLLKIKCEMLEDSEKVIALIAIKHNKLYRLQPLWFVINEICDCLIMNKQCAAITLTNHLLESSLKLSLILWKAYESPFDNSKDFETMFKKEVKMYIGKKMGENLDFALEGKLISNDEHQYLTTLMLEYRDHIDHASNNKYIRDMRTIIATYDFATKESTENLNARVTNNPLLYLNSQENFMRKYAYDYFSRVYYQILKWDKMIHDRYTQNNSKN